MKIAITQLIETPCYHQALAAGRLINGSVELPDDWSLEDCGRSSIRGLGDVVALIAQPIAGAIDAVAGTNLKGCGGCADRREKLNELMPL